MTKTFKIVSIFLVAFLAAIIIAMALYEGCVEFLKVELADIRTEKTLYIAHRGLSSKYYENTKEAFEEAGKSDFFFGIETDIHKTADGSYVCSHDRNPFSDQSKIISSLTLKECLELSLKDNQSGLFTGNERLCTFEDYLNICKTYNKTAIIELKEKFSQNELKDIVNICKQFLPVNQIIMASFIDSNLETLASIKIPFGLINFKHNPRHSLLMHKASLGYSMGINASAISLNKVKNLHKRKVAINVWTINDKKTADKFEAMGVDYITTDCDFSKIN